MPDFIQVSNCRSPEMVLQRYIIEDGVPSLFRVDKKISSGEIDCGKRISPSPIQELDQVLSLLAIYAKKPVLAFFKPKAVLTCLVGKDHCVYWREPGKKQLALAQEAVSTSSN